MQEPAKAHQETEKPAPSAPVVSGGPRREPFLDGVRSLSALMILVMHASSASGLAKVPVVGDLITRTEVGPAIFFALSGYLLAKPWVRAQYGGGRRVDLKRFARHRFLRIVPAYWAILTLILLTTARGTPAGQAIDNYLFLQIYEYGILRGFAQSWSVCTEVSFYAALPLVTWFLFRRSRRFAIVGLLLTSIAGLAFLALVKSPDWTMGQAAVWLPSKWSQFAAGMLLALLLPCFKMRWTGRWFGNAYLWLIVGTSFSLLTAITAIGGSIGPEGHHTVFTSVTKETLFTLTAFFLVGMALLPQMRGSWLGRFLDCRPMLWLAKVTYSFYLLHMAVLIVSREWMGLKYGQGGFFISLIVTLVVTSVLAQLFYWAFEQPFMRLAGRWDARSRRRAANAGLPEQGRAPASVPTVDVRTESQPASSDVR